MTEGDDGGGWRWRPVAGGGNDGNSGNGIGIIVIACLPSVGVVCQEWAASDNVHPSSVNVHPVIRVMRCWIHHRSSCSPWPATLVAGALCFALAGCAGAPVSTPPPLSVAPDARETEETLAALRAREARIHTLKGLFQADVRGGRVPWSRRIHGTLFYRRPDVVRVTGVTRAGGTVFDFLLRDRAYELRVPERRDVLVGRAAELPRLGDVSVPIRLSLRAVELLLGKALPSGLSPDVRIDGDAYRYSGSPSAFPFLTVPDAPSGPSGPSGLRQHVQHVWVDRHSAHLRAVEYRTAEDETRLALSASDFRPVPDGRAGAARERRTVVGERAPSSPLSTSPSPSPPPLPSPSPPSPSSPSSPPLPLPFVINATNAATPASVELTFLELAVNVPLPERAFRMRGAGAAAVISPLRDVAR